MRKLLSRRGKQLGWLLLCGSAPERRWITAPLQNKAMCVTAMLVRV